MVQEQSSRALDTTQKQLATVRNTAEAMWELFMWTETSKIGTNGE